MNLIPAKDQSISSKLKILSDKDRINACYEQQNGVCMFENCNQSIYAVLNAKGSWSGQLRFLGVCEKHFEENIKKQNKESNILGITRF